MDDMLRDMLEQSRQRRERDKAAFEAKDHDLCMLCGAYGADKRSLTINCGYAVYEVVPEALDLFLVEEFKQRGYYLCICKSCRSRLLGKLQEWRNECVALRKRTKDHDGYLLDTDDDPEQNIYVRINGVNVAMTRAQYDAYAAATAPAATESDGDA